MDEILVMTDEVADEDYYYLHDHLKSPVALLDIDGEILERYEYDAYGKATLWEGDYDNLLEGPSWYNNPYYFTGRRLDVIENGTWMIQYHRHRFYDYQTGRWLNQDPIGSQDGVNLYQYAKSNPLVFADPFGLVVWTYEIDEVPCTQGGFKGTCCHVYDGGFFGGVFKREFIKSYFFQQGAQYECGEWTHIKTGEFCVEKGDVDESNESNISSLCVEFEYGLAAGCKCGFGVVWDWENFGWDGCGLMAYAGVGTYVVLGANCCLLGGWYPGAGCLDDLEGSGETVGGSLSGYGVTCGGDWIADETGTRCIGYDGGLGLGIGVPVCINHFETNTDILTVGEGCDWILNLIFCGGMYYGIY